MLFSISQELAILSIGEIDCDDEVNRKLCDYMDHFAVQFSYNFREGVPSAWLADPETAGKW